MMIWKYLFSSLRLIALLFCFFTIYIATATAGKDLSDLCGKHSGQKYHDCLGEEIDKARIAMHQTYLQAKSMLCDVVSDHNPDCDHDPGWSVATQTELVEMQERWLLLANDQCGHAYEIYGSGSMRLTAPTFCMHKLYSQRTELLREVYWLAFK